MLSFSTDFPISDCSADEFARCVGRWVEKMPLGALDGVSIDGIVRGAVDEVLAGNHRLNRLYYSSDDNEALGFRHTVRDEQVLYSTEIVYSRTEEGCWVGIRNDRVSDTVDFNLRESKKPQIIKSLIKNFGGAPDGDFAVRDFPHFLQDSDTSLAIRLMTGLSTSFLPIIFVSRSRHNEINIDVDALARMAGGLAHVVIEPSRDFSRAIQFETEGRNAYNGAVGVYMPSGDRWLILSDRRLDHDVRIETVERVRKALLHRRPRTWGDWQHLQGLSSRSNIELLKESGSTDLEAFIREFDAENGTLKRQLDAANSEIADIRAKLRAKRHEARSGGELLRSQNYYPHEGEEFVRDALQIGLRDLAEHSRRHEKVAEAIANLPAEGETAERRERLKAALNKATHIDDALEVLRDLGFSLISEKNHYKLIYNSDDRYIFISPKTASDFRAFKNLASDIAKLVY